VNSVRVPLFQDRGEFGPAVFRGRNLQIAILAFPKIDVEAMFWRPNGAHESLGLRKDQPIGKRKKRTQTECPGFTRIFRVNLDTPTSRTTCANSLSVAWFFAV